MLPGKSRTATFLDEDAKLVIVVTVTGQVIVWNRDKGRIEPDETARFNQLDRAMDIWHEPVGRGPIWIRLATGELMRRRRNQNDFEQVSAAGRCVAMGGCGSMVRGLLNQSQRLSLLTVDANSTTSLVLPRDLDELTRAKAPFLVTMGHVVAVGARDHGLWLSADDGTAFRKIAGCRDVTACGLGLFSGRVYAWAALFFELHDRAEMVGIDCKTLRVQKLAEYHVVTDSSGPEDDPPERARIDCLMWDAPRQRILAAGCFGLTCFVPPHSSHPTS